MFIGIRLDESKRDGLCGSGALEHAGGKLLRIEGIGRLRQLRRRTTMKSSVSAARGGFKTFC